MPLVESVREKATRYALLFAALFISCWITQQALVVNAIAQEQRSAVQDRGPAHTTKSGAADGVMDNLWSPALTGERRPLYRLRQSDVIEIAFTFAPEFDQTVTIQPDGYISLKGVDELFAAGKTVPELREALQKTYTATLHRPEIMVRLKEFDKPSFIATGEVNRPGKYELRGDVTLTEALAIAGGFNGQAKHSQVVLFRRMPGDIAEAKLVDVKKMLKSRDLREDIYLRPGDMLFVPQNAISKIRRYLPATVLSSYFNAAQY